MMKENIIPIISILIISILSVTGIISYIAYNLLNDVVANLKRKNLERELNVLREVITERLETEIFVERKRELRELREERKRARARNEAMAYNQKMLALQTQAAMLSSSPHPIIVTPILNEQANNEQANNEMTGFYGMPSAYSRGTFATGRDSTAETEGSFATVTGTDHHAQPFSPDDFSSHLNEAQRQDQERFHNTPVDMIPTPKSEPKLEPKLDINNAIDELDLDLT